MAARPVILLLGGTADAPRLAWALAEEGCRVLVSNATSVVQCISDHPRIRRRQGQLDAEGLEKLIRAERIDGVVDATHPYATGIKTLVQEACRRLQRPCIHWQRPEIRVQEDFIDCASDHVAAANLAATAAAPILLTTGSRNLQPYITAARDAGQPLYARVLADAASVAACQQAGLTAEQIITGRGPFSLNQNLSHIQQFNIGVLVSKNSGVAGGLPAKIEAARRSHIRLVLIQRPSVVLAAQTVDTLEGLLAAVAEMSQEGAGGRLQGAG